MKFGIICLIIILPLFKIASQDNSELQISLFMEEQLSNDNLIELLSNSGFSKKNLANTDFKIYSFGIVADRSKLDFNGIQIDIISDSRYAICRSCETLRNLTKTSENTKVFLIKNEGFNSECLKPSEYQLFPTNSELNLLLKKEKKLAKKIKRHIVLWYPKNTISIKEFSVNKGIKPVQIENGQEITIDFFLSSTNKSEEIIWTDDYNVKFNQIRSYKPGYNTEKFKPSTDSKYCLNFLPHQLCLEKICTDLIKVENKVEDKKEVKKINEPIKLKKIPMIKEYKNIYDGRTCYILNEMEDGKFGAEYEVSRGSGGNNDFYNFIVPKQDGIEEYKLKISRLQFKDKPNNTALLNLEIDKSYKDDKFTRLSLKQTELYYDNSYPVHAASFFQYKIVNSAGESNNYIESEIRIIPSKIKNGYVYDFNEDDSESVLVIFQFCNH